MCMVSFNLNQQCTHTYSTKKMGIIVFMIITENDNFKYS